MTVQEEDLERLATELLLQKESGYGAKKWCEKAGVSYEAVTIAIDSALQAMAAGLARQAAEMGDDEGIVIAEGDERGVVADASGPLMNALGEMFRLGWETRDQYGRPQPGDTKEARSE